MAMSTTANARLQQHILAFRATAEDTQVTLSRRRDNMKTRRLCLVREPGWIGLWSSDDERALRSIEDTLDVLYRLLRF
jgi:hypothetical protein